MLRIVAVVACLAPAVASAHSFKRSFADLKPNDEGATALFDLDPDDLDDTLQARFDLDRSGMVEVPELERGKELLAGVMRAGMVVYRGGARCTSRVLSSKVNSAAMMVRVALTYACELPGPLRVEVPLLERVRKGHAHLMTVRLEAGTKLVPMGTARLSWEEPRDPTVGEATWQFLVYGVEHILIGYDHLLFLFALLILTTSVREIAAVVTAFTIAHSITLIAAALGVIELPQRVVEAAIALTIAGVGVQNLLTVDETNATRKRWLLTFALGLVHGFGFASVLAELKLPPTHQVLPLLSFNVGVELGQLGIVVLVVPALFALRRETLSARATVIIVVGGLTLGWALYFLEPLCAAGVWVLTLLSVGLTPLLGYRRTVVYGGSALVIVLGLLWFVVRAFG